MPVSFTPLLAKLGIAHGDLRLVYSSSAMETHFMKLPTTVIMLTLLPDAVWDLVVSVATQEKLLLHAKYFSGLVL